MIARTGTRGTARNTAETDRKWLGTTGLGSKIVYSSLTTHPSLEITEIGREMTGNNDERTRAAEMRTGVWA